MKKYDVDPLLGLFALARENKIDFSVLDEPGWFPFNFEYSLVYSLNEIKDLRC